MKQILWSSLSARKRRIIGWVLILVILYGITGFFILPPIIRAVAIKELSTQLDRKVSIRKIKLNPFVPSVAVDGLLIQDKDGQRFVSWEEVYVSFQLSSVFAKAWTFREIRVVQPYARAEMNKDYTFNFSDLIQKFSTNAPATPPKQPSKPLLVRVKRLNIIGARVSVADFAERTPFRRMIGPMDFDLGDFRTAPDENSSYWFAGATDTGENFYWRGRFCLNPLSSRGQFTVGGVTLNKFAALYQDLLPFTIRDGQIAVSANYKFALDATNRVAAVTDAAFALWDFKLARPGDTNDVLQLSHLAVTGIDADAVARRAEVGRVMVSGANIFVQRGKNGDLNIAMPSRPAPKAAAQGAPVAAGGGIPALLSSITNTVAMILASTNQGAGVIHEIIVTNSAVRLEDLANSRPVTLDLNDISVEAKNISNLGNTNLTLALSLDWNKTGKINAGMNVLAAPLTADIHFALDHLDLSPLDPYLESQVNVLIPRCHFGMDGDIHVRTPPGGLPDIEFQGATRLDDFRAVDGVMGEDLLAWDSIQVSGIDAKLNPVSVSINKIFLDHVSPRVVIETNGAINLLMVLNPAGSSARSNSPAATGHATASTANSSLPPMPPVAISSIVFTNTQLQFTDRSVYPAVSLAVLQGDGTINGITTAELQHGDIDLHALVDGVGPVAITGRINPFSGTQTNLVKVSLKSMDLLPTSPYSGKFAGYRIARGNLNVELDYQLVGRKLKSQNVIVLDQFTFGEKVNSPEATKLPVRLAIDILKDREGKIVLDVPIEGSLDDPKFRISKVVVRALENILAKVATSPFGLLGAAFGGGGQELSYEEFAPGSADLSAATKQKLDVLTRALYNRPGLQLEISGSVDPVADHDGLERVAFENELRLRQWKSLRKSQRAALTPDEIVLTPEQRTHWIKELYNEALNSGQISPAALAANTNLAAMAAQIQAPPRKTDKLASYLSRSPNPGPKTAAAVPPGKSKAGPPVDPKEALLIALIPVSDSDLEELARRRAQAVRSYLLSSGKVEANRLFLTQSQNGGLRQDGNRVYLQLD